MIEGSLSRRYARALFQLALEERSEEEIGQEIERFGAVYGTAPLNQVLDNPAFSLQARKNVLAQVAKSLGLSPLSVRFLSLSLERDRLTFLPSIVARYRRLLDQKRGQVEARVAAASALGEDDLRRLGEALGKIAGKRVALSQESDASLIGGLVIHLEGKIYDGSVRTQLDKMKRRVERGY